MSKELARLRARFPEYADLSDAELALGVIRRFPGYSDVLGPVAAQGVGRSVRAGAGRSSTRVAYPTRTYAPSPERALRPYSGGGARWARAEGSVTSYGAGGPVKLGDQVNVPGVSRQGYQEGGEVQPQPTTIYPNPPAGETGLSSAERPWWQKVLDPRVDWARLGAALNQGAQGAYKSVAEAVAQARQMGSVSPLLFGAAPIGQQDVNLSTYYGQRAGYPTPLIPQPTGNIGADLGSLAQSVITHRGGVGSPVPGFYSKLGRALDERLPPRATPEQILGTAAGAGVKAEELQGLGAIVEALGPGPAPKSAVLEAVRSATPRVQEIVRGEPGGLAGEGVVNYTKYSQWQLPGGTNYRELLLTLQGPRQIKLDAIKQRMYEISSRPAAEYAANPALMQEWDELNQTRKSLLGEQKERPGEVYGFQTPAYRSPHWDEPNVLAHVRFNDRVDAAGKKTLFLEEVQSDWHQSGRERGYGSQDLESQIRYVEALLDEARDFFRSHRNDVRASENLANTADTLTRLRERVDSSVPHAPFAKTWHELALKRMLQYAAERGYDQIAWTTGAQQADRYSLAKQINELRYDPVSQKLQAIDVHRNTHQFQAPPEKLPDYIGKELTQRLLVAPVTEVMGIGKQHRLTGIDLEIGGEGMKGFYDKIIPAFLNSYAKKWGARVGDTNIRIRNWAESQSGGRQYVVDEQYYRGRPGWAVVDADRGTTIEWWPTQRQALNALEIKYDAPARTVQVHSLPITPAMRQDILSKGQPLYSVGGAGAALNLGQTQSDTSQTPPLGLGRVP